MAWCEQAGAELSSILADRSSAGAEGVNSKQAPAEQVPGPCWAADFEGLAACPQMCRLLHVSQVILVSIDC